MSLQDYQNVFGPQFFISSADGSNVYDDITADVIKFVFDEDEKKQDKLVLTLNNKDLKYVDDPRFVRGLTFQVRYGYASDISDIKTAIITQAKPKFPRSGVPTMEIAAYDLRQGMNRGSNAKNWGRKSSSEIAQAMAERYHFKTEIEASNDVRNRTQTAGETDFQYMLALASKLHWDFYLEGDVLHFHKKRYDQAPKFEFTYYTDSGGDLLEFEPEINFKKPKGQSVGGASPKTGKAGNHKGEPTVALGKFAVLNLYGDSARNGNTKIRSGFAGFEPSPVQESSPTADRHILQYEATGAKSRTDMAAVKAKALIIGSPRLQCRVNVKFNGLGHVYSGNWRIAKVKHTIVPKGGDIYVTEVEVARDGAGDGSQKNTDKNVNSKDTSSAGNDSVKLVDINRTEGRNIRASRAK